MDSGTYLPLRMQSAMIGLLFFSAGYYMKQSNVLSRMKGYYVPLTIGFTAVTIGISVLNGRVDMASNIYGNVPLFILGASSGIMAVIIIAKNLPAKAKFLQIMGRNSIVIYLLHISIIIIAKLCLAQVGITKGIMVKIVSFGITYVVITMIILFKEKKRQANACS